MYKDKIIPIKYGGSQVNVEAHANTETGQVEESSWDIGPSNEFMRNDGNGDKSRSAQRIPSDLYRQNYIMIFKHD